MKLVDATQLSDSLRLSGVEPWRFLQFVGAPSFNVADRWMNHRIPDEWLPRLREHIPSLQQTIPRRERKLYLAEHMRRAGHSSLDVARLLGVQACRVVEWARGDTYPSGRYLRALLLLYPDLYAPA